MKLSVIPNSSIPAYKQLSDQLTMQILSGELKGGTTLPPIRTVAKELGISVITVRTAWDELIESGLVESRAGSGCYAAQLSDAEIERIRLEAIKEPVKDLLRTGKNLGFSKKDLIRLIENE